MGMLALTATVTTFYVKPGQGKRCDIYRTVLFSFTLSPRLFEKPNVNLEIYIPPPCLDHDFVS